ncbi:MAG: hypothetical protein RLZZ127_2689, partial [Planctomycetota bacterium]
YLEAAREPARTAVGRFVRDWIGPGATAAIITVRFRGEPPPTIPGAERATIPRSPR